MLYWFSGHTNLDCLRRDRVWITSSGKLTNFMVWNPVALETAVIAINKHFEKKTLLALLMVQE